MYRNNRVQKTEDRRQSRGSLSIEYTVLTVITVAALLGMQVYIRRAICGKWRSAADGFGHGRQYEHRVTTVTN